MYMFLAISISIYKLTQYLILQISFKITTLWLLHKQIQKKNVYTAHILFDLVRALCTHSACIWAPLPSITPLPHTPCRLIVHPCLMP